MATAESDPFSLSLSSSFLPLSVAAISNPCQSPSFVLPLFFFWLSFHTSLRWLASKDCVLSKATAAAFVFRSVVLLLSTTGYDAAAAAAVVVGCSSLSCFELASKFSASVE